MKDLRITLVQSSLFWENKEANLKQFESVLASLHESSHIVVLPEMFTTGFTMNAPELAESLQGQTMDWLIRMSAKYRCIITGSFIVQENECYYNRLIWMQPNGAYGTYNKRHLFRYAGEDAHYTSGDTRLVVSVNGWKLLLLVCYDLRFPVWSRQQTKDVPEYDAIIYIANWPAARSHAWKSLLTARAIENQCYVAGVNRIGTDGNGHRYQGDSMLIDPVGEIIHDAKDTNSAHTISLSVDALQTIREKYPFLKDADSFQLAD